MEKLRIGITTDCVCDLPQTLLQQYRIGLIPFYIITESGRFCDMNEITSDNVLEYITSGHKAISVPSSEEEYRAFFQKGMENFDRIIHISASGEMSAAYGIARKAAEDFDGNVCVFDSKHISTGSGHIVMKAAELVASGEPSEKVIAYLTKMRDLISTSFMAYNIDYLYLNGQIEKFPAKICKFFDAHPIINISKDGKMVLGGLAFGNYDKAAKHYIKKRLKHTSDIDRTRIYITHAGCSSQKLALIKKEVEKYNRADCIEITNASATVSSNCGPNSFGVIFVHEKK